MDNIFVAILFSLLTNVAVAAEGDWEIQRDKEDIQVYTRSVEGSPYKEVKVKSTFEGRISSLVALIGDAGACADWAEWCENSYFYQRVSESEAHIYTHNNLPFPVKDRDVLAHVKWTQDSRSKVVEMLSMATTDILETIPGRLRLTDARTIWRFAPLGKGQVKITNQTHMNPGSSLPGWITNILLVDTPFKTMKAFTLEAGKPKYADAKVPFVTEP